MSARFTTELPQRKDSRFWPLTATTIAASAISSSANGGSQQRLPVACVPFLLFVGQFRNLAVGLVGGASDQWIPIFNGSSIPLSPDSNQYYLAQFGTATAAVGDVTVLGLESIEAVQYWKTLLGSFGGDSSATMNLAQLPAANLLADAKPLPTTTIIGSAPFAYDPAANDLNLMRQPDAWEPKKLEQVDNVSSASTGIKATYTVPAGRRAQKVRALVAINATGGASWRALYTPSGGTAIYVSPALTGAANNLYTFPQSASGADHVLSLGLEMGEGDVLEIEVTAAGAGSTADILITGQESRAGVFG